jgi:hypothetical protein
MNFADAIPFLKTGLSVAAPFIPGGGAIVAAINAFLPDSDKLADAATGGEILAKYQGLSSDQRLQLESKQIDFEIAESNNWAKNVKSLADADASGSSTRPQIAMLMAYIVVFSVVALIVAIFWAAVTKDSVMINSLSASWELILVALGTPSALLRAYFAMRTKEKQTRYAAAANQPIADVVGGITKLFGRN